MPLRADNGGSNLETGQDDDSSAKVFMKPGLLNPISTWPRGFMECNPPRTPVLDPLIGVWSAYLFNCVD